MSGNTSRLGQSARQGFTLIELLAVLAIIGILVLLLGPAVLPHGHPPMHRIKCINNLKNVGLGFRIFASDNEDRFPWTSFTNSVGVSENPATNAIFAHISAITNELRTPRILYCTSDTRRREAANWETFTPRANMSYFVAVTSDERQPDSIMSGDSNFLLDGRSIPEGAAVVGKGSRLEFDQTRHNQGGNILMTDGSVQQLSNSRLSELLSAQTNEIVLVTP